MATSALIPPHLALKQWWNDDLAQFACPLCPPDDPGGNDFGGAHCIHLAEVTVNAGGNITHIASPLVDLTHGEPAGRGTHIYLKCWCEAGHAFDMIIYFHKGDLLLKYADVHTQTEEEPCHDLWRD